MPSTLSVLVAVSAGLIIKKKTPKLVFYFLFACPDSMSILVSIVKIKGVRDRIFPFNRKRMLEVFFPTYSQGGLFAFRRGRWLLLAKH